MRCSFTNSILVIVAVFFLIGCSSSDDNPPINLPTQRPTAVMSFNTNTLFAGSNVVFTDNSDQGSSPIISWNWTFTGATPSTSSQQNPTVVFNGIGQFSASLTVTTNNGSDSVSESFVVINSCPLYDCEKFPVTRTSNIEYGIDAQHLMNIYLPLNNTVSSKPAILINGGGAYEGSNLELIDELAERLSSYGFVVATARYRNGVGNATANLLRGMVDSKAAIRYLRANADTWEINSNQLLVGGWSSGAYNALIHAFWQESDVPQSLLDSVIPDLIESWEGEQGNPGNSSEVSAVINLAGSLFGTEEAFQNDLWITPTDVPMFAVYGENDAIVPCGADETETGNWEFGPCIIDSRLQSLGITSELIIIPDGSHESPRESDQIDDYLPLLVDFINDAL